MSNVYEFVQWLSNGAEGQKVPAKTLNKVMKAAEVIDEAMQEYEY